MNIGISGPIGAGKTTASKYLSANHGLSYLRYSEILAEMFEQHNPTRSALRDLGWQVMSGRQQKALNEMLLSKTKPGISYVIDGLRHPIDLETLSTQTEQPFYLLYIDASPTIRWQRVKDRDGFRTWEEFKSADCHPIEGNLLFLKQQASKILSNEGTLEVLELKLDEAVKEAKGLVQQ